MYISWKIWLIYGARIYFLNLVCQHFIYLVIHWKVAKPGKLTESWGLIGAVESWSSQQCSTCSLYCRCARGQSGIFSPLSFCCRLELSLPGSGTSVSRNSTAMTKYWRQSVTKLEDVNNFWKQDWKIYTHRLMILINTTLTQLRDVQVNV